MKKKIINPKLETQFKEREKKRLIIYDRKVSKLFSIEISTKSRQFSGTN